jgi:hypothetical protein
LRFLDFVGVVIAGNGDFRHRVVDLLSSLAPFRRIGEENRNSLPNLSVHRVGLGNLRRRDGVQIFAISGRTG